MSEVNTMNFETPQEEFWAGSFGNEYIDRNKSVKLIPTRMAMFSKILSRTSAIKTAIEFGSNIGHNLIALRQLLPDALRYKGL